MESLDVFINPIVKQIDAWLDTMRCREGYGGPISHWWQNCLQFTGAGLDWRYEGIILGYLNLYRLTRDVQWLAKAKRAGDDLIRGQMISGNFKNSNFEANPYPGGTPHEAACDLGLLSLAQVLKTEADPAWEEYAVKAEFNLKSYIIGRLWEPGYKFFRDETYNMLLVLNKAATIFEALHAWAQLTGNFQLLEQYGLYTLESILANQIQSPGTYLDGAIDQSIRGNKLTGAFFPYYNARCIPALIKGYEWTNNKEYLKSAFSVMTFILRTRLPDGSFPQVIYSNGKIKRYPQWIAGVGDILRSMDLLQQYGLVLSARPTMEWFLKGVQQNGGMRTAYGFGSQANQKTPASLPDFLDILPVCGWVDKAFCYLAGKISGELSINTKELPEIDQICLFQGKPSSYHEDLSVIEVLQGKEVLYRWQKGKEWADTLVYFG